MKTLNFHYLLLPDDGSHIQSFLYKFIKSNKINAWHMGQRPFYVFEKLGIKQVMRTLAVSLAAISHTELVKIKLHECKIVRKNGRKNKKKTT